jgi:putative ABC transport system ATP-binding protein
MLSLRNVSRAYFTRTSQVDALVSIDLDVRAGEFVAVLGPSGCGKSSLLNIMGLLDSASSGYFSFYGTQVVGLSEPSLAEIRRYYVSFLFQNAKLVDELSVRDNVRMGVQYRGLSETEQFRRADEALEWVGMAHRAQHRADRLSAGQQRLVELARAIARRSTIIFADEPAGNLDQKQADHVMRLLRALNSAGTTVIMSTHSPACSAFADTVVHLLDGACVTPPACRSQQSLLRA